MKVINKRILLLAAFIAISALSYGKASEANNESNINNRPYKVYISQLIRHPALDETTRGIIDGLKNKGYEQGKNLDLKIEYAQGDVTLAVQIAQKFINNNPDVVVGNPTVNAQSLIKYAIESRTKLVFTTVTDPLGAGLVKSLEKPGNNTSGVSNFVAVEPQIEMFKEIMPKLKRLGVLYNPGEMNSISLIKKLEEICPKYGIQIVLQSAARTNDVYQSMNKLVENVDAIFISNDNTALSAMSTIIKVASSKKIPVFVSDTDIVEQGAVAALGPNQYEIGLKTADMIDRVLRGEDVNNIPVEFPTKTQLFINWKAAEKLGLKIPEEVLQKADRILG